MASREKFFNKRFLIALREAYGVCEEHNDAPQQAYFIGPRANFMSAFARHSDSCLAASKLADLSITCHSANLAVFSRT